MPKAREFLIQLSSVIRCCLAKGEEKNFVGKKSHYIDLPPKDVTRQATFGPDTTVTISGLASTIATIAPDQAATVQQIRHWTREGMLPPVQHPHSGPGKHREYTRDAAYEAAILQVFNGLGLPISGSLSLLGALDQVRREVAKRKVGKGKKNPHLIIAGGPPAGVTVAGIFGQAEKIPNHPFIVTIDINLAKLFEEVERGLEKVFGKVKSGRP